MVFWNHILIKLWKFKHKFKLFQCYFWNPDLPWVTSHRPLLMDPVKMDSMKISSRLCIVVEKTSIISSFHSHFISHICSYFGSISEVTFHQFFDLWLYILTTPWKSSIYLPWGKINALLDRRKRHPLVTSITSVTTYSALFYWSICKGIFDIILKLESLFSPFPILIHLRKFELLVLQIR